MKLALALVVLFAVGCSKSLDQKTVDSYNDSVQGWESIIPDKDRDKATSFCLQCIKNNTPTGTWHGSSPEDIVRTCRAESFRFYGVNKHGTWYRSTPGGYTDMFVPDKDK